MDLEMSGDEPMKALALWFSDQSRFRSAVVTRAFSWAMQESSEWPQSEVTAPHDVMLRESADT
jgi:hypothetical protein